jgi:hypothetical protein
MSAQGSRLFRVAFLSRLGLGLSFAAIAACWLAASIGPAAARAQTASKTPLRVPSKSRTQRSIHQKCPERCPLSARVDHCNHVRGAFGNQPEHFVSFSEFLSQALQLEMLKYRVHVKHQRHRSQTANTLPNMGHEPSAHPGSSGKLKATIPATKRGPCRPLLFNPFTQTIWHNVCSTSTRSLRLRHGVDGCICHRPFVDETRNFDAV